MPENKAPTARSTTATATKRKSLLSELGIKAGEGAPTPKPTTRTTSTSATSLARKSSVPNKPSSPSVSRTKLTSSPSPPTAAPRKKVPPSNIKVDRTAPGATTNSPTSPNPRRRSIVPTTSSQRATMSPLARRSSVNSSTTLVNHNKRVSSPAGLESLAEVQTMKEQLEEKEKQVETLKENETILKSENEKKVAALESELKELKEQLSKLSLEKSSHQETKAEEDDAKQRAMIQEVENKLRETHKFEMETLMDSQEKRLESELQALKTEYDQTIQKLKSENSNQIDQLIKDHDSDLMGFNSQLEKEQELRTDQDALIAKLRDRIQSLEDAQTNSHLRKVQNELDTAIAALEDFKRQSQQTTEQLEKRYREEIRQLQNGSDDTAQAWLEKTRSAQQKVDQLHDQIHSKEQSHAELVHALKETHAQEIDKLTEALENKEAQIEEQSSQIEDLLFQVETLQNSLEAATVRLEHTAKSTPTSSSNRDDINNNTPHDPIKHIHQECLDRIDAKQKELDQVKSRLSDIKETHEIQLNRLGQEKANALQELRKTITNLEQKLAAATPPHSPTRSNSVLANGQGSDEERLIRIAEQHRKEIKTMHEQYQRVVDTKDRELEDYAYRVKALVAAKQKDIEKLQIETNNTIDRYERDIEGYEAKIIEYEKESIKLKDRITHWETLSNNNEALVRDLKRGCVAHLDENAQLARLVNQLQSEIHQA